MKNEYVAEGRPSIFFWHILAGAGLILTPYFIWILVKAEHPSLLIILPAVLFGAWVSISAFHQLWNTALKVHIENGYLRGKNWLGSGWDVPLQYLEMMHVKVANGGIIARIRWPNGGGGIYLSDELSDFGLLIEEVLGLCKKVSELNDFRSDLTRLDYARTAWQKEPDWDIINAAIARAEENRKKREPQS